MAKENIPESFTSDEQIPYQGNGTIDDPFVVEWLPDDVQNPMYVKIHLTETKSALAVPH